MIDAPVPYTSLSDTESEDESNYLSANDVMSSLSDIDRAMFKELDLLPFLALMPTVMFKKPE